MSLARYRPTLPGVKDQIGSGAALRAGTYDRAVAACYRQYELGSTSTTAFAELARVLGVTKLLSTFYFSDDINDKAEMWTLHCSFGQALIIAELTLVTDSRLRKSFSEFDKALQEIPGDVQRGISFDLAITSLSAQALQSVEASESTPLLPGIAGSTTLPSRPVL